MTTIVHVGLLGTYLRGVALMGRKKRGRGASKLAEGESRETITLTFMTLIAMANVLEFWDWFDILIGLLLGNFLHFVSNIHKG